MALKAKEALTEEEEEEQDIEEAEDDAIPLRTLHNRIAHSSYPLSDEALALLHQVHNLDNSLLSHLLLHELKSLKSLIPPTQGDEGSTSCVITNALNYLEQLSTIIQGLKESNQELTSLSGATSKYEDEVSPTLDYTEMVKVESLCNTKVHILVNCKKRVGLLSSLILAFDTLGLVIDQMDISCDDVFQLDVITTQVGEKAIDNETVKRALSKTIHDGYQNVTKI